MDWPNEVVFKLVQFAKKCNAVAFPVQIGNGIIKFSYKLFLNYNKLSNERYS